MKYFAYSFLTIWLCGWLFLAGRSMNFSRLVLNNIIPGKESSAKFKRDYLLRFRFLTGSAIDPEVLTESGRIYLKQSIRNDRIKLAWTIAGFILIALLLPYT